MGKPALIKSGGVAKDLLCIICAALILRILPALFGSPQNMDVILFRAQAVPVLNHQNIYQVTHKVFPYSPLTMFIPALCLFVSNVLNIPFHITMKIPALIGDISLAIAVYYWVIRAKKDVDIAFKAALLYAVNPIAILISGFQGNIMTLPTLFIFLAVMMLIYDCEKNYRLSALLFGLAIAFRGYPILLLPLVLLKSKISTFKKLKYAAYAVIPTILVFLPFLLVNYKSLVKEVFGYSGFMDYGFAAVEKTRSLYYFFASTHITSINNTVKGYLCTLYSLYPYVSANAIIMRLAEHSKVIFLCAYLILLLLYKRFSLLKSVLMVYLAFYVLYSGVSSQYLIWILPFLYFLEDKFAALYIILGFYAVISVYLCYYPPILLGVLPVSTYPDISVILANGFIALSLFWSLCAIWFFNLLFKSLLLNSS